MRLILSSVFLRRDEETDAERLRSLRREAARFGRLERVCLAPKLVLSTAALAVLALGPRRRPRDGLTQHRALGSAQSL